MPALRDAGERHTLRFDIAAMLRRHTPCCFVRQKRSTANTTLYAMMFFQEVSPPMLYDVLYG